LFDGWQSRKPLTEKSADKRRVGGFFGPHVILEELRSRIPRYLDEVDHGGSIRPASGHFRIKVTPISRPLVKGAEHFFWQHWLPSFLICRFQLPCSNRARFFG